MVETYIVDPMSHAIQRSNPNVCELIRIIFEQFAGKNATSVSQFRLLKTLFLTKERLSDDNSIKDQLAFYWYRYGPYSQVFVDNLAHMKSRSLVTKGDDGRYTFSADIRTRLAPRDGDMDEAAGIITELVRDFLRTSDIRHEVYKIAPYKWYTTYNDFRYKFQNCYRYLFDEQKRDLPCPYDNIDILIPLHKTLTTIPDEPIFQKLRPIYYAFAHTVVSLLEAGNLGDHRSEFDRLCQLSEKIWNAFAYGVRILYHDRYYKDYIQNWQGQYEDALDSLCQEIDGVQKEFDAVRSINVPVEQLQELIASAKGSGACTPDKLLNKIDKIIH